MKMSLLRVLTAASFIATSGWARDITTTTGQVYHNAVVTKTQPDGVRIAHDDGVGFIDYQMLSEADRREFGFDPVAYAAAGKDEASLDKRRKELQLLLAQRALYLAAQAAQAAASAGGAPSSVPPQPAAPQVAPGQTNVDVNLQTPAFTYDTYGSSGWITWPGVPSTYINSPTYIIRNPRRFIGPAGAVSPQTTVPVNPVAAPQTAQPNGFRAPAQVTQPSVQTQTGAGNTFGGRGGSAGVGPAGGVRR